MSAPTATKDIPLPSPSSSTAGPPTWTTTKALSISTTTYDAAQATTSAPTSSNSSSSKRFPTSSLRRHLFTPLLPFTHLSARHRLPLSYAILILGAASSNGYDGALISSLQALPAFNTNLGLGISSAYKGLIIAGIALGGVVFFFPAAWLADMAGRRATLMLGATVMLAASIIQGFTQGPAAFLVTRIALGAGLAFTQTSAAPLLNEIATPKHRAVVGAFYNALYFIGSITAAWVTFGTLAALRYDPWAWRIPCLVQAVFPLGLLVGVATVVPESPRFLLSRGRMEEARDVLVHLAGQQEAEREIKEITDSLAATAPSSTNKTAPVSARSSSGFSYLSFLTTPADRWRLWILIFVALIVQWAGQAPASYYLAPILSSLGITDPLQQAGLNGGLQVWSMLTALTGAALTERSGRRALWLTSLGGMLASEVAYTVSSSQFQQDGNHAAGLSGVVFLFLISGFYSLAITPLAFLYPVEVTTYRSRAKGLALNQFLVFLLGAFNQFVNPIALDAIGYRYYCVFIALLVVFIGVVVLSFPETRGMGNLEQIEEVFEKGWSLRNGRGLRQRKVASRSGGNARESVGEGKISSSSKAAEAEGQTSS